LLLAVGVLRYREQSPWLVIFGQVFSGLCEHHRRCDTHAYVQVKRPMSLDVVQAKLSAHQYAGAVEFVKDVLLIFSNATLYNDKSSKIAEASLQLDALFKSECAKASSLSAACISAAAAAHEEQALARGGAAREHSEHGSRNDETSRVEEGAGDGALGAKDTPQFKALTAALALTQLSSGRTCISKVTQAVLRKVETHLSGKVQYYMYVHTPPHPPTHTHF
jgi:hypothetical protein